MSCPNTIARCVQAGSPSELKLVKNAQPLVAKFGGALGTMFAGIDMWLRTLKIGLPFTMKHHTDAEETRRADLYKPIAYPKPDGKITFDRLSSVFLSGTNHDEDQPCHLVLKDPTVPERINLAGLCRARGALLPGRGLRIRRCRGGRAASW